MSAARVRFVIRTAMAEALINRAAAAGIRFAEAQKRGPHELTVWVYAADEAMLTELLEENSVAYRVTGRAGLARGRAFLRRRAFLAAGLIAAGLMLMWVSSRVWVIAIDGAGPEDETRITAALTENGAYVGAEKKGLDFMRLRRALEAELPEYAFFGVKTMGVTLTVNAVRADDAPEPYRLSAARDLVAECDGVVLSVHAAAGTALVKPGDTVRRGDVLIRGEERLRVGGEMAPVRAEGSVIARLWTEAAARVPLTICEARPTGLTAARAALETPFFTRVLTGENPFAQARERREVCDIVGLFVPVRVTRTIYAETAWAERPEDPAAARAAAEALARALARKKAPAGADESKSWTEYEEDAAGITARVAMEWTKEIARGAQGG